MHAFPATYLGGTSPASRPPSEEGPLVLKSLLPCPWPRHGSRRDPSSGRRRDPPDLVDHGTPLPLEIERPPAGSSNCRLVAAPAWLLTEQPFFRLPIGASALLPGDDVLAGPHVRHRDAGSCPSRAAANEAGGVSPALAPIPIKPGADFFSPNLPPDKASTDLPIYGLSAR